MSKIEFSEKTYIRCTTYMCNSCGKYIQDIDSVEWSEMLHIEFTTGYYSIFGDGLEIKTDLCQKCVKEILGPFLQIYEKS